MMVSMGLNPFNRKKGQAMSLEMIIGLIILLVVAFVIIRIFITRFSGDILKPPEQELSHEKFLSDCKKLCTEYRNRGRLDYCTKYFEGKDWNGNRQKNENITIGSKNWEVCESRIYCFHVQDCEWSTGELTMDKCRELLCQEYLEKYNNDIGLATGELHDDIKHGNCKPPGLLYWYDQRFRAYDCTP